MYLIFSCNGIGCGEILVRILKLYPKNHQTKAVNCYSIF